MKKILLMGIISVFALSLAACGDEAVESDAVEKKVVETNTIEKKATTEQTQEELNEEIKKEAVRADFVELNVDNPPVGKKVYIEGEVSGLIEDIIDEFTLTSKEGNGYGIYNIESFNTTNVEYSNGDIVRVYGAVKGRDESGIPEISAPFLENK